ncbi:PREDICTED: uncharacterized protein LOC104807915 isoform X2 [Tarenaya hassleriana]|uniref:uncharacterized protein LOC104807915 isoform X2 n=1 Tax=Tarenaya hassleriana TaxID=28532 RepID=UPI00053CA861|nr:PREDICTED: uncharacterized protein LOC104807915 isoform X2 [Tarenaya hassleriana]
MEDFASVVPGSSDSQSLLSEPPDIRKWFSSYVYESVPLNSLAGESEAEEHQLCAGGSDRENVGAKFGSNKDCKPRNMRPSPVCFWQNPDGELSESIPSEPPDIGNWFSSYIYESPVLDTSDGLVLSLPGESEEIKEKGKRKEKDNEETKIEGSDIAHVEFEHEPFSSSKVTDFSDPPSMLSEPPNVGIWFSSYEYESPVLSETRELGFSSPEKEQLIIEESDAEDENSSGIFRKPHSKKEVIVPDRLNSSGIGSSSDKTHSDRNLEKKPSRLWNVSTEELKQESSFSHGSFPCEPKQGPSFLFGVKPQSSLNHGASFAGLKPQPLGEIATVNSGQTPPREATQKARLFDHLESTTPESDDKENVHGQSTETGFVTTRKGRFRESREGNSRTKPDRGILVECSTSKRSEKISGEGDEETKKRRRVLGETTNLQYSRGMEMAGIWVCPQKNKPSLAPPLKQLRLDAWVHRI